MYCVFQPQLTCSRNFLTDILRFISMVFINFIELTININYYFIFPFSFLVVELGSYVARQAWNSCPKR